MNQFSGRSNAQRIAGPTQHPVEGVRFPLALIDLVRKYSIKKPLLSSVVSENFMFIRFVERPNFRIVKNPSNNQVEQRSLSPCDRRILGDMTAFSKTRVRYSFPNVASEENF
ncbi:MAG TPA: hypothetical protein VGI85_09215 [Chthoniobacterales bacterium]|jgi:hypothetical protein